MKIKYLLLVTLSIGFTNLMAQNEEKVKWLAGSWKVVRLEIPSYEAQMKAANPEQKAKYKAELQKMMKFSFFEFKPDGSYQIIFSGNQEKGKWKFNQYASKLIVQKSLENGMYEAPNEIGIEYFVKNQLILLNDYESGEIIRMTLQK
jgi:hypothetical protein